MKKELLTIIKTYYDFNCIEDIKRIKKDYPHILELNTNNGNFILKIISKLYCESVDMLYNYLSSLDNVLIPEKTINNKYSININDKTIIIYKKILEIKEDLSPIWWANNLEKIHNLSIDKKFFQNYELLLCEETITLFNLAASYFNDNIKKKLVKLLECYDYKYISDEVVLCHSDPNNSNVMIDGLKYKFIDTDGIRLLPKEFDIQRLFQNEIISGKSIDEILNYWNSFYSNYHNNIDIKLLKRLYVYDLVRVYSWLTLVSNDIKRVDRERQTKQLNLYQESILEDKHEKVLKIIK